jgi:hypothetical protein
VLFVVGSHGVVYAVLFPIVMVVSLVIGPLFGLAAAQALFTVLVAVLFAQLAPVSPVLAGTRALDVVIGGVIGVLMGVAVWPRGGRGELRRAAARCLQAGADRVEAVVGVLAGIPGQDEGRAQRDRRADHDDDATFLGLLDSSYAQFRSEPHAQDADPVDWLAVLGAAHRLVRGAEVLHRRFPCPVPSPWPDVSDGMMAAGYAVADSYRVLADALARDTLPRTPREGHEPPDWVTAMVLRPDRAAHPDMALRVVDGWGWLWWLADDIIQVDAGVAVTQRPRTRGLSDHVRRHLGLVADTPRCLHR